MQFSDDSSIILNYLLPKFKNIRNTNKISKISNVIDIIYDDLTKGNDYYTKISDNINIKLVDKTYLIFPDSFSSNQYSQNIKKYVKENIKKQFIYKFNIYERKIEVSFSLFSDDDVNDVEKYNSYIKLIIIWLHICNKYTTKKCSNVLKIYLNLTHFKKELPKNRSEIIGYEHINTGMTYRCVADNEIFIYRKEEWFKVLIHETFHSYGLDIDTYDNNIVKSKISKLFPIDSTFNIAETYTEVWARILNCCFCSFLSSKNKDDFKLFLNFSLHIERIFSIIQMNKILYFMGLQYKDLWANNPISKGLRNTLYKEQSNAFCYFILGGVLMNDYVRFLNWCLSNNTSFIKYKPNTNNDRFMELIIDLYKKDSFIDNINNFNNISKKNKNYAFLLKTCRMSCIELDVTY
jgi:hypothetical protein